MTWHAFDNNNTLGERGSENGIIIRDEEHSEGARITLEARTQIAPFTITCGIYGWMVHTRFFGSETEAQTEFNKMRDEIAKIINSIPPVNDPKVSETSNAVSQMLWDFVKKFP